MFSRCCSVFFCKVFLNSMRADPTHGTTECWMVDFTWFDRGLPKYRILPFFGGSKIGLFWGSKIPHFGSGPYWKNRRFKPNSPILRDAQFGPKSALRGKTHPIKIWGPWDHFVM